MISVIIPIYNAANYLSNTLSSLISQEENNWEAILVDDGSTDDSNIICAQFLKRDDRFHYYYQPNSGVSSARNTGLEHARGEWLFFLDADDYLPSNSLSILLQSYQEGVDLIIGGYEVFDNDSSLKYNVDDRVIEILDRDEAIALMYKPKYYSYLGYIWGKLFKASIIHNYKLSFNPDIVFNEDRLFVTQYIVVCNHVLLMTEPVYHYIEHPTSAIASREMGFNDDYVTDMDAMILMRETVSLYSPKNIKLATEGIACSYWQIQYFMNKYHAISLKKVLSLHKKLWKELTLLEYLKYIIVPFIQKIYKKLFFISFNGCQDEKQ